MQKPEKVKIGIVGVKDSGFATANFFLTHNDGQLVQLTLFDDKSFSDHISAIRSINPEIEVHPLSNVEEIKKQRTLVVSPGVPLSHPSLVAAKNADVQIIGDIELWARIKAADSNARFRNAHVVGITGSNGKTTVTELTTYLFNSIGIKATKAGNIGVPILSTLSEDWEVYVLELSSFQLDTCVEDLKLDIATILNISDDHLDRYKTREDYIKSKQRIYDFSNKLLYNKDDTNTFPTNENRSKHVVAFSSRNPVPATYHYDPKSQTLNIPNHYNDRGPIKIPIKEIKLKGMHNYENILASLALVRNVAGYSEYYDAQLIKAVTQFEGLPHRYQEVHRSEDGVSFINDSKATNIGSVIAAIKSSEYVKGTIHLLLGGQGKGQDFSQLTPYLDRDNIKVYCYGIDGETIYQHCPRPEQATLYKDSAQLEQVMPEVFKNLQRNDMVLLSPACASLDYYKNYEERGEVFTKLAKKYNGQTYLQKVWAGLSSKGIKLFEKLIYPTGSIEQESKSSNVRLYDGYFLSIIFSIFVIGLITVISASVYYAEAKVGSYINWVQLIPIIIGIGFFFVGMSINSNKWHNLMVLLVTISLILLALVLVVGSNIGGARRWISILGFTFQPAEIAKFVTVIYMAHYITDMGLKDQRFQLGKIIGFIVYLGLTATLLMMQPDFGTTLMLMVLFVLTVTFVMPNLWRAVRFLIPTAILAIIVVCLIVAKIEYLQHRIAGFFDPLSDPYNKSYQIVNSLSAYARGGFWGVGLGNSVFKTGYLTEANTDYILAIFSEEHGFIGLALLVILEVMLYLRMFKIAHESFFKFHRPFQATYTFILILWLAYQSMYNFFMTASLLPTDGSTFPLISYGGSSYLVSFLALGIVFRIDYENRLIAYGYKVAPYKSQSAWDAIKDIFGLSKKSNKNNMPKNKSKQNKPKTIKDPLL